MNRSFSNNCEKFLSLIIDFEKSLHDNTSLNTLNDILDQLEINLDKFIPFHYSQIFLLNNGNFDLMSSFTPEGLSADTCYMNWVIDNKEITMINDEADNQAQNILFIPLIGNKGPIGVVVLWVDFSASDFTQGLSAMLMLLGQIISTRIEAFKLNTKLESSQSQLSDIVESVGHGILAIDSEGYILLVNGTMELIFNLNRKKIIGKHYKEILSEEFSHVIDIAVHAKGNEETELSMVVPHSSITLGITASCMHFGNENKAPGFVILCRDLSLTLELSKMREVDIMKNDFLSLVSHELRTPLTSILAYTEALLIDGMVENDEDRKEYLEIIHSEGERLTRLINDVLDLTKMESGKMGYNFMLCNLGSIIRSALNSSTVLAEKSKIKLTFIETDEIPKIYCDVDRITQVILNFISNAIKFTPEGGRVTIELLHKCEGDEESAYVIITDTGIGIAPEDLNKVFSRFEQIESLSHHSHGTGLGMPICKKIIEMGHRGKIGLSSKIGVGSKFFFSLPIESQKED